VDSPFRRLSSIAFLFARSSPDARMHRHNFDGRSFSRALSGLAIRIPHQHPPENLAHFGYSPRFLKYIVKAILAEI
jgi:hypothetical protein